MGTDLGSVAMAATTQNSATVPHQQGDDNMDQAVMETIPPMASPPTNQAIAPVLAYSPAFPASPGASYTASRAASPVASPAPPMDSHATSSVASPMASYTASRAASPAVSDAASPATSLVASPVASDPEFRFGF